MLELKEQLKLLRIQNRKSLRTSEHLAITKSIMKIEEQIEELS